jgi:hypothetical protein
MLTEIQCDTASSVNFGVWECRAFTMCANENAFSVYRETAGHLESKERLHKLYAPHEAVHRL